MRHLYHWQLEAEEAKLSARMEKLLEHQSSATGDGDVKDEVRERFKKQRRKIQLPLNMIKKEKRRRGLLPPLPEAGGDVTAKRAHYRGLAERPGKIARTEPTRTRGTKAAATEAASDSDDENWGPWEPVPATGGDAAIGATDGGAEGADSHVA